MRSQPGSRSLGRVARLLPAAWLLTVACGSAGIDEPAAGGPTTSPPASPAAAAPAAELPAPAAEEPQPASEKPAQEPDEPYSNRIRWQTASELNNFGYDVYRGESPEGPFERINPRVIEGAGTTDEPTSYEYVDLEIDPHTTYYYYVESISMSGVRERFTPIGKAPPKIPSPDEEPEGTAPETETPKTEASGDGTPDPPGPGAAR